MHKVQGKVLKLMEHRNQATKSIASFRKQNLIPTPLLNSTFLVEIHKYLYSVAVFLVMMIFTNNPWYFCPHLNDKNLENLINCEAI